MLCPALHYLVRQGGWKVFRLLQHLAYFGWCLRNAPTSSYLSSSAFCSFKWGSHNCFLCKTGVLELTLKRNADLQAAGMHKSALVSVALFLRYFPQLERNHNVILALLCSQPSFLINETGKHPPHLFPHSTGLTVSQWGPSSPVQILVGHRGHFSQLSLASCKWPLFVVCFVVISLVLKDILTSRFCFL